MSTRQPPGRRADYRWFHAITTRWMDNDVFQHVNNVNYFSYFDTAVTYYEMSESVIGLLDGPTHCVVAEVMCRYHSSLSFPDRVTVGVRVANIGRSSVRYDLAVEQWERRAIQLQAVNADFQNNKPLPAASTLAIPAPGLTQ